MAKSQDDSLWGAKATPEVIDLLDELYGEFEKSAPLHGLKPTKKEYLEHLARLDKANNVRKGMEGTLPVELLKTSAGDLNELLGYTNGINKLYLRMIERSGMREHALVNEIASLREEHEARKTELELKLQVGNEKVSSLQTANEELVRKNELFEKENHLCKQESLQHSEALRLKDSEINEKNRRIADIDQRLISFESIVESNRQLKEELREVENLYRDAKREYESSLNQLNADHRLAIAEVIQKERDAAQEKIANYRDQITAEYRQEVKELRAKLEALQYDPVESERRKPGRPAKTGAKA